MPEKPSLVPGGCTEMVNPGGQWGSFHLYQCRKPVTTEGSEYCNRHIAMYKRRAEQNVKWQAKQMANHSFETENKELLDKIYYLNPGVWNGIQLLLDSRNLRWDKAQEPRNSAFKAIMEGLEGE